MTQWIIVTALVGVTLAVSTIAPEPELEPRDPTRITTMFAGGCRLNVDIRRDERPACWQWVCPGKSSRQLACDVTAMHQVVGVTRDREQRWLAVTSVGEGHPFLEIVAVAPLIEDQRYEARCTVNPYPGTLGEAVWQHGVLRFETDVDLSITGVHERVQRMDSGVRRFDLDPGTCIVSKPMPATNLD